jgi:hypothetical protein
MKGKSKKYKASKVLPVIFMMMSLLWLTVSAPFVYAGQKEIAKQQIKKTSTPLSENEQENSNPFGNSTEEKTFSSNSFSEEYLHDHDVTDHFYSSGSLYNKHDDAEDYIAFHGELLVPPPNAA